VEIDDELALEILYENTDDWFVVEENIKDVDNYYTTYTTIVANNKDWSYYEIIYTRHNLEGYTDICSIHKVRPVEKRVVVYERCR